MLSGSVKVFFEIYSRRHKFILALILLFTKSIIELYADAEFAKKS